MALGGKILAAQKVARADSPAPALIDQQKCIHCGTCFKNCPVKAIGKQTVDDVDTYTVDAQKCISCGTCIKNCPVKAIDWQSAAGLSDTLKSTEE